ncbi:MAG TPA: PEP-CTERM sorting domain-containing protein [Chthoniobacteraceae bacterium]
MNRSLFHVLVLLSFCAASTSTRAEDFLHGHINAGIIDTAPLGAGPGDDLAFYHEVEGLQWESGSGNSVKMTFNSTGRYAGHYVGSQTFTAMSARSGSPEDAQHPSLNSFIQLRIVSVAGPAGGTFSFWENTDLGGGSTPTFTMNVGAIEPSPLWALTQDEADGDPYGHIHGRRFTATSQGTYTIGFRLFDTSTSNSGGPIHDPSRIYLIDFAAIPEPASGALLFVGGLASLCRRRRAA